MKGRILNLYKLQNGKCFYCKIEVIPKFPGQKNQTIDNPTKDHIVCKSIAKDLPHNTIMACVGCNRERSNMPFVEFLKLKNII